MSNPRDVELDIVGHDHTGAATRSAGNNLDKLRRKVDETSESNTRLGTTARKGAGTMAEKFVKAATLIRSAGPYAVVAAIGVGIAALPAIATAAGAGMVAGLGGGLLALGLKFASMNKDVRSEWSKTKQHVVSRLQEMSKPFVPVLENIARRASATFDSFAPELDKSFRKMAPALDRFSVRFFGALLKLKPAIRPLTQAFTDLLNDIGPKLPGLFSAIAGSITKVATAISKNPGAVKSLITGLQNTVTVTGNVVAALIDANNYVALWVHSFQAGVLRIRTAIQSVAVKFYDMVADVAEAGARLPGPLGAQFRKVAKSARQAANDTQSEFNRLSTSTAQSKVQVLQDKIKILGNQKATPKVSADIRTAEIGIAKIRAQLLGIKDRYVNVFVSETRRDNSAASGTHHVGGFSAGSSWASVMPGQASRTGGPQQISVTSGATTVNNRVFIDGNEIRSVARSTIQQETDRAAWRARTGRR